MSTQDTNNDDDTFNVEEWMELYKKDPEAFEAKRAKAIEETIAETTGPNRHRLRGLQFQIDVIREKAKSPMGACLKITQLMWKKVGELQQAMDGTLPLPSEQPEAVILPFNTKRREND